MVGSIYELYGEIWGDPDASLDEAIGTSLGPASFETLYDRLGDPPPTPADRILDIGSRDAKHAEEIVRRFGCRVAAVDPIPLHTGRALDRVAAAGLADRIEVTTAAIEKLPFDDSWFDHIWCRDMLVHVDLAAGLAECFRVLKPGGIMLVYQTFETDWMEPLEARRLYGAMSIVARNMSPLFFEATAQAAGFEIATREIIGSEWQENRIEAGDRKLFDALLGVARLQRARQAFEEKYGAVWVETAYADRVWGIYQMLGKLCPRVYRLRKPSA